MNKKNVIVGQSGGPTSAINSSLYGVVTGFLGSEKIDKIYGMVNGIEAFLPENDRSFGSDKGGDGDPQDNACVIFEVLPI